jgi:hypothetical protein
MAQFEGERNLLVVADQSGGVTAIDVDSGEAAWPNDVAMTGESFVAGVSGIIHRYASTAFQDAYASDVLFVGSASSTGNLFALDARDGSTIWTLPVGYPIRALVKYDSTKNWIYVATDGGGVIAYDLATSNDGGGTGIGTPPDEAIGWVNPDLDGSFSLSCTGSAQLVCADRSGSVMVLDKSTGSVIASGPAGFTSPSSVSAITGGVLVSNSGRVAKLTVSGTSLVDAGTWAPEPTGTVLSPVLVYQSVGSIYVAGSDRKLHKVSIATMTETASVSVASQTPSSTTVRFGAPNYDITNTLFIFGSSDGHLWAVKYF